MSSSDASELYFDGPVYDLLFPGRPDSELFMAAQAQKRGDPLLELACGTGILTLPLASRGHDITGLDLSAGMLEHARAKSEAHPESLRIQWVQGDMRDFQFDRQFALIFVIHNSISHLHSHADFAACMACVQKHLAPGGRFIVNTFVPNFNVLTRAPGARHPFGRYRAPDSGNEVVLFEENEYDPVRQINTAHILRQTPGQRAESLGALRLRMYFPQEFDALLQCNGFTIEQKFGDYHGAPFGAGEGQAMQTQLCVCAVEP